MLEVKNLKKSYKTKGGVEVHALDDVSIKFPETGMVFLLGKSGSGKSTLLNVSGGLDRPDEGEVIVKGKSSKDFSQSDFDSYRNTFVGFVFQEYNILSEFNVESNIALALELQGKKNDKKVVNELLKQVDLEGLGKRKPNTLSGGQKQRIAIARALIKEPEIIMADEPTGALDSNTGKQVLDTLKKLSKTKLVIVVSHDRDFAEYYGDRIIELKDGKVILDVSKNLEKSVPVSSNVSKIGENTYQIKDSSKLKKEDFEALYKKIKNADGEVIISTGEANVKALKKASRIDENDHQEVFKDTVQEKIDIKEYDGKQTKFIRSKLPMKHAFRMGGSNLKIKPGRLIFTMFLSIVAFSLFGVLSTLATYNPAYTYAEALQNSDLQTLVLSKGYTARVQSIRTDREGKSEVTDTWDSNYETAISKSDITKLNNNNLDLDFAGFYKMRVDYSMNVYQRSSLPYYSSSLMSGLTDCGETFLLNQGFSKLAGRYPADENEIAISKFTYEIFKEGGYNDFIGNTHSDISSYNDLLGKKLNFSISANNYGRSKNLELTIVGIYETDEYALTSRYDILKKEDRSSVSERELNEITDSFSVINSSSYYGLGYVSSNFYDKYSTYLKPSFYDNKTYISGDYFYGNRFLNMDSYRFYLDTLEYDPSNLDGYFPYSEWDGFEGITPRNLTNYTNDVHFVNMNGDSIAGIPSIADNEVYLNLSNCYYLDSLIDQMVYRMDVTDYEHNGSFKYVIWAENKPELLDSIARYFNFTGKFWSSNEVDIPIDNVEGKFGDSDIKKIITEYKALVTAYGDRMYDRKETSSGKVAITSYLGKTVTEYTVKGFVWSSGDVYFYAEAVLANSQLNKIVYPSDYYVSEYTWSNKTETNYVIDKDAQYSNCICKVNKTTQELDYLLQKYEDDSHYGIVNSLFFEIDLLIGLITQLETIFLIAGAITAVFSGLMLLNFISTSISTKQKEIGILRAVGARGSDVFKIYFSESGIITGICFIISVVISFITCRILDQQLAQGLNIALFNFGPLNLLFILAVSALVSFAGTIVPVSIASRRPPVESIRAL